MVQSGTSFILPRGSNLTNILTKATFDIRDDGDLITIEDFFDRLGSCPVRDRNTLTFWRLRWFFISAYSACGIMFLFLVVVPQDPASVSESSHNESNNALGAEEDGVTPRKTTLS